jgi:Trk-type K+ transport system membrane component
MSIKAVAIVIFIAILASLGSALFHLVKRKEPEQSSANTAKALTVRIGLSLLLFVLLFLAFATGLIQPSGIGSKMAERHAAADSKPQPTP